METTDFLLGLIFMALFALLILGGLQNVARADLLRDIRACQGG